MSEGPPQLSGPRTLSDAKRWMHARIAARIHPFVIQPLEETAGLIDALEGLDGESWAKVWGAAGEQHFAAAIRLEASGQREPARDEFHKAYGFFMLGRFPCPNHPAKLACYRREMDAYLAFGRLLPQPVERITIPIAGPVDHAEWGSQVAFYLRRPAGVTRPPVVVMWGGVDAWKEEMTEISDLFLAQGVATVSMDNVGTGESPFLGAPGGERQFLAVFDWLVEQADLDGGKPALLGRSFGGHWATRLAHQYPDRLSGAVNWGGGVHHMFQPDWVDASRYPESYLMELVETRSRMLGASNYQEYLERFSRLSLLEAGLLDQPCAPMLLVNGKEDRQCPIADLYILLDYGSPKCVRLFPGGHMGFGPRTIPTIVDWVVQTLARGTGG